LTPLKAQQLRRRLRCQPFLIRIAQPSSRDSSPSLISRTVTPNTPEIPREASSPIGTG
jgi:hypothetical protein